MLNFDLSSGALLGWRLAGRPSGGTFLDPMVLSPAAAVVTDFDAVSSRFGSFVDYTISGHEGAFRGLIVTESAAPVPEPSSVLLLGIGIALLWARRRLDNLTGGGHREFTEWCCTHYDDPAVRTWPRRRGANSTP